MDLEIVADELYGLPPSAFTAARDGRAAEAKKAGERELLAAIKALRRPTVGAWLANQLARSHGGQLAEFLALGQKLRQAQQDLAGDEVRALSQERRRLISALSAEAQRIAEGAGQRASEATLQELETTLGTGLVDPGAAELIRLGRVTAALTGSAMNDLGLGGSTAVSRDAASASTAESRTGAGPKGSVEPKVPPAERKRALAAVAAAEAVLEGSSRSLAIAKDEHASALGEVANLEERLTDARALADKRGRDVAEAETANGTAEQQLLAARERAASNSA